jgi:hypothetical protein
MKRLCERHVHVPWPGQVLRCPGRCQERGKLLFLSERREGGKEGRKEAVLLL